MADEHEESPELEPDDREYEAVLLDAARWRALLGSEAINVHGYARPDTPTMHFDAAFWITYPGGAERDAANQNARDVLTAYADAAIAAGKG